jgi:hypothetical protein
LKLFRLLETSYRISEYYEEPTEVSTVRRARDPVHHRQREPTSSSRLTRASFGSILSALQKVYLAKRNNAQGEQQG